MRLTHCFCDAGGTTPITEGSYPSPCLLVSNLNVRAYARSTVEARLNLEVQTKTTSLPGALTRWRVLLPVAMSILSASLMVRAELRGMGKGRDVPTRVINSLLNGPGFYLSGLIPLMPAP